MIDNRPGAGGTLAATMVAKSAPDGYTIHVVSPVFAIRAALFPDLPYDSIGDLARAESSGHPATPRRCEFQRNAQHTGTA